MGIIDKLLNRKGKKKEAPAPVEEVVAQVEEETAPAPESSDGEQSAEEPAKVADLPEGKVNREPVKYVPAPKPNPVFNPDLNEKDPKIPSYL